LKIYLSKFKFQLIIFKYLEKPRFDKSGIIGGVKEIKVKAGEPINIELPLVGTPAPQITWLKNGKILPNNTNG